jgi:hypothetical protein
MLEPGSEIEMTKGYKGVKGTVMERTESEFEFYILKLDNGIQLVAGPAAFVTLEEEQDPLNGT